jgi:hypothetical protein
MRSGGVPSPCTPGAPAHWATKTVPRRTRQVVVKRPLRATRACFTDQKRRPRAATETSSPPAAGRNRPPIATRPRRKRAWIVSREGTPASPPVRVV